MSKDKEERLGVVPKNDYREDLEADVAFHVARIMATKPFRVNKKYTHIEIPEFDKADRRGRQDWEMREIERCKNGYDGLPGRFYFGFHHCHIKHKTRGKIRPDFRAAMLNFALTKEKVVKTPGRGLVSVKRRQIGASWDFAIDNIYDCSFNRDFDIGMNSKGLLDGQQLFFKHKYVHRNVTPFLRTFVNSDRRDAMIFSKWIKKEKKWKGTGSSIISVAPTPTGHAGNAYAKAIVDEAGEQVDLMALWSNMEECLMDNDGVRVGTPYIFGTMGETTKAGKGLMEFWTKAEAYNLERHGLWGYNCCIMDDLGNDNIEESVRAIIYNRKRREGLSKIIYDKYIQKWPLEEQDAFLVTGGGGIGSKLLLSKQYLKLQENPPLSHKGFMRRNSAGTPEFVADEANGKLIIYERPQLIRNGYVAACLPEGEEVLTDEGLKPVEQITEDNKLVNESGENVHIKKFYKRDVEGESIFSFKLANTQRTTSFTGEHPILVSDHIRKRDYTNWRTTTRAGEGYHAFNFQFRKAKDIKVGEWVKIPNIYRGENDFDINNLWVDDGFRIDRRILSPLKDPDFWWLIGLLIGDGFAAKNGYRLSVTFNITEKAHADRLKDIVRRLFDRSTSFKVRGNALVADFGFQQLNFFITKHFGRYAAGKHLPEWVKRLPAECKKQLLLGYLDSDGCIYIRKDRGLEYSTEFVGINLPLLEDMQDILFSMGVIGNITKMRDAKKAGIVGHLCDIKPCYHLRLSHHDTVNLAKLINDARSLKLARIDMSNLPKMRKRPKYVCYLDKEGDYIYFRIRDIVKSSYTGTVYNFECDTHTYLAHHITTHNCDPAEDDDVLKSRDNSNLGTAILAKPGADLLPPRLAAEYVDRPAKLQEYYEQLAMLLQWYNNTPVLVEMNKGGYRLKEYFEPKWPKLLQMTPKKFNAIKQGYELAWGIKKTPERQVQLFGIGDSYVENYWDTITSTRLIEEFKVFGMDHADDDFAQAFLWALLLLQGDRRFATNHEAETAKNPDHHYQKVGNTLQLIGRGGSPAGHASVKTLHPLLNRKR